MRPTMTILSALALALAVAAQSLPAPSVHAQTLDKDGRCRGPDGLYATDSACKGAGPAPAASSVYRLDSHGQCRDAKGRMAKAEKCGDARSAATGAAARQKP